MDGPDEGVMALQRASTEEDDRDRKPYLKDHADADADPPENVIVFDEAQRAWDADTGLKLLGRAKSEPELFMEIMGRLPWACLVCLVGSGQEINRGEGGLALWGEGLCLRPRCAVLCAAYVFAPEARPTTDPHTDQACSVVMAS
ncbi:DNA/RNA helicase domain-containing protein [Roseovarius gaetbuli]|uniref:DNA/RNA helicase domain-containing protein n=1 Tax=Roseovarius gaetbuli TaxID=1356575 RepID=UPI000A2686C6|nr:DNA/RNA helicase domain-containing protein [Roseovarius gaetbuli]